MSKFLQNSSVAKNLTKAILDAARPKHSSIMAETYASLSDGVNRSVSADSKIGRLFKDSGNPYLAIKYKEAVAANKKVGFGRRDIHTIAPSYDGVKFIDLGVKVSIDSLKQEMKSRSIVINPIAAKESQVISYEARGNDINAEDGVGLVVFSGNDHPIIVEYGDRGVRPFEGASMSSCFKHKLQISEGTVGVLRVENYVPFSLKSEGENKDNIVVADSLLRKLPERMKIEEQYSLTEVLSSQLPVDMAKVLSLSLQQRIHMNKDLERFFAEVTLTLDKPTTVLPNSATAMNFEELESKESTDMHWHPGDRVLLIIATGKECGADLNFCGVNEDPKARQDLAKKVTFPKNSISLIRFPGGTHHKFFGDFVCISFHPEEGQEMINFLASGKKFPEGFLSKMTVVSGGKEVEMRDSPATIKDNSNSRI